MINESLGSLLSNKTRIGSLLGGANQIGAPTANWDAELSSALDSAQGPASKAVEHAGVESVERDDGVEPQTAQAPDHASEKRSSRTSEDYDDSEPELAEPSGPRTEDGGWSRGDVAVHHVDEPRPMVDRVSADRGPVGASLAAEAVRGAMRPEIMGERALPPAQQAAPWLGLGGPPPGDSSPFGFFSRSATQPILPPGATPDAPLPFGAGEEAMLLSKARASLSETLPLKLAQAQQLQAESGQVAQAQAKGDAAGTEAAARAIPEALVYREPGLQTRPMGPSVTGQQMVPGSVLADAGPVPVSVDVATTSRSSPVNAPRMVFTHPALLGNPAETPEFINVQPNSLEVQVLDQDDIIKLTVAREEDGLAVKVRAPTELVDEMRAMEIDVEAALDEGGLSLSSYEAEARDPDEPEERGQFAGEEHEQDRLDQQETVPIAPLGGGQILNRIV